jgi:hypothetical protein
MLQSFALQCHRYLWLNCVFAVMVIIAGCDRWCEEKRGLFSAQRYQRKSNLKQIYIRLDGVIVLLHWKGLRFGCRDLAHIPLVSVLGSTVCEFCVMSGF